MDVSRKNAVITGANRGIGKAIVEKFKSEDYEVFAPTREELNLMDMESIKIFVDKYKDIYFDVIINNAGCNEINKIEDITDEELKSMMFVNLIAPIKLSGGLVPQMKKNNYGKIINIASIWAVVSKPGRCVYSATKNGVHGVTNTLALELAPFNILVNTVCPGFTLTELTKKNNSQEEIEKISADIPLKRMAEPQEIADVVFFLGNEKNTYLTGQKIIVDGGFSSK